MNTKIGKTYYYEGNKSGQPRTKGFEFEPPFGVVINKGVVEKKLIELPWDEKTKFYECMDFQSESMMYGTAFEIAIMIGSDKKTIKKKSETGEEYRNRFIIQKITMDEFFKETKRFKQEKYIYA